MNFCGFCGCGTNIISIREHHKQLQRKIYEDKNFYIIVSIGALVEGHLLIIPKEHYLNMGEMPGYLIKKLEKLINSRKKVLKDIYNKDVIVFEHGTGMHDKVSSASVIHAHTHLIPVDSGVLDMVRTAGYEIQKLSSFIEIERLGKEGKSYLFYQDTDNCYYNIKGTNIPSQYFRKIVSEKFGLGEWNWHKDYKEENILKTLRRSEIMILK